MSGKTFLEIDIEKVNQVNPPFKRKCGDFCKRSKNQFRSCFVIPL